MVQQRYIVFIVDLASVMETLFIITVGGRAIKSAYNAYTDFEPTDMDALQKWSSS